MLFAYGLPKVTITAMMMISKNMKAVVSSLDRDTDFFDIVIGILQGDTVAPYLCILCLNCILQMAIDLIKEHGFILRKQEDNILQ